MVTGPVPRKGNSRISGSASGAGAQVGTLAGCSTLLSFFLLHFFHLNPIDPFLPPLPSPSSPQIMHHMIFLARRKSRVEIRSSEGAITHPPRPELC